MKKKEIYLATAILFLLASPYQSQSKEIIKGTIEQTTATNVTTQDESLLLRLNEINEMDKSELKSSEKRELRKEVRTIKHKLEHNHGGIYISVGAAIIIVLLLIILL